MSFYTYAATTLVVCMSLVPGAHAAAFACEAEGHFYGITFETAQIHLSFEPGTIGESAVAVVPRDIQIPMSVIDDRGSVATGRFVLNSAESSSPLEFEASGIVLQEPSRSEGRSFMAILLERRESASYPIFVQIDVWANGNPLLVINPYRMWLYQDDSPTSGEHDYGIMRGTCAYVM